MFLASLPALMGLGMGASMGSGMGANMGTVMGTVMGTRRGMGTGASRVRKFEGHVARADAQLRVASVRE